MRKLLMPGGRSALAGCLAIGLVAAAPPAVAQTTASQSSEVAPLPELEGEPLESGPLHEAFASPVSLGRVELPVVFQEPPPDVDELPPEVQPEGQNVQWIPGYWAWLEAEGEEGSATASSEDGEFIWISGLWRDVPQRQTWVTGVWSDVTQNGRQGWQWTSGYWIEESRADEEIVYLPPPPEPLEQGPNVDQPNESSFWVPGCWIYQESDYNWRPGYWHERPENFVWVPSYYQPTPRGYVFVNGYWDYPVVRRGLPLAPVRFANLNGYGQTYPYRNRQYLGRFRPQSVIRPSLLVTSLFVSVNQPRYFYGNYFGNRGSRYGVVPLYQTSAYRGGFYDPIYADLAWRGRRGNRGWDRDFERGYLEREQAYLNSDFSDANRLVGDLQTLRSGGGLGDIVVNRISADRYERYVDERLDRLDDRERRRRSLVDRDDRDGDRDSRTTAKPVLPDTDDAEERMRDRDGDAGDRPGRDGGDREEMRDDRPGADRPDTDRPDVDRPNADRPGTDRPDADQPGSDRPEMNRPDADRPDTDRPDADRPDADRPEMNRPDADRPGADRPDTDRPETDRPGADLPGTDRPEMNRPGADRPDRGRGGSNQPGSDQPGSDQPGANRPGADRPGADRPAADRPGSNEPGSNRPGGDAPAPIGNDGRPGLEAPSGRTERGGQDRSANRPITPPQSGNDRGRMTDRPTPGGQNSESPSANRPGLPSGNTDRPGQTERPGQIDRPGLTERPGQIDRGNRGGLGSGLGSGPAMNRGNRGNEAGSGSPNLPGRGDSPLNRGGQSPSPRQVPNAGQTPSIGGGSGAPSAGQSPRGGRPESPGINRGGQSPSAGGGNAPAMGGNRGGGPLGGGAAERGNRGRGGSGQGRGNRGGDD